MKKILIFLLFFTTSLSAEKVERLGFYNIQELLEDDNLTYKIIKSCVSLNSAITEITREDHPELSKSFFATANYLYPFGILTLAKIKKLNYQDVEKEYQNNVSYHWSISSLHKLRWKKSFRIWKWKDKNNERLYS